MKVLFLQKINIATAKLLQYVLLKIRQNTYFNTKDDKFCLLLHFRNIYLELRKAYLQISQL